MTQDELRLDKVSRYICCGFWVRLKEVINIFAIKMLCCSGAGWKRSPILYSGQEPSWWPILRIFLVNTLSPHTHIYNLLNAAYSIIFTFTSNSFFTHWLNYFMAILVIDLESLSLWLVVVQFYLWAGQISISILGKYIPPEIIHLVNTHKRQCCVVGEIK